MKKITYLSLALLAIVSLIACQPRSAESDIATVTNIILCDASKSKTDTITKLSSWKFTVDKDSCLIYNVDSLPYLARVDSLTIQILGGAKYFYINDSIKYTKEFTDTLDFTQPITIRALSEDQKNERTYRIDLRIHQIDPYEYNWEGLVSEIYTFDVADERMVRFNDTLQLYLLATDGVKRYISAEGKVWNESSVTGFPANADMRNMLVTTNAIYVMGGGILYKSNDGATFTQVNGTQPNNLLFVLHNNLYGMSINGGLVLLSSTNGTNWEQVCSLPTGFPVSGAAVWSDTTTSGAERAFVVGGRDLDGNLTNAVFCTENGEYWANMLSQDWFTPREGAAIVQYDSVLMMFGGKDNNGLIIDYELVSPDFGITWRQPRSDEYVGSMFVPRYNISAATDHSKYVYIMGGRTETRFIRDIWRGRRNLLLFEQK